MKPKTRYNRIINTTNRSDDQMKMIMLEYTRQAGGKAMVTINDISAIIDDYEEGTILLLSNGDDIAVTEPYTLIKDQLTQVIANFVNAG